MNYITTATEAAKLTDVEAAEALAAAKASKPDTSAGCIEREVAIRNLSDELEFRSTTA